MMCSRNGVWQWCAYFQGWQKMFPLFFSVTGCDIVVMSKLQFGSTWWRHQMETFSALLAIFAGNSPVTGEFPAQRPVTRSFDVFLDLRLNQRLSKQSRGWWFETPSFPLWRHCDEISLPIIRISDAVRRHFLFVDICFVYTGIHVTKGY